ncbi:hypothetical protein QR680_007755 [Steinernema hermaphroditum]|uniref:Uncharacterized protein n=1 Tax=Steinernema hermaphroditum TaxID=289476 RepID=A0AA39IGK7_9BILA|nr:hypothetical protein QR680_007755 [Steinernema hermaphroditum]
MHNLLYGLLSPSVATQLDALLKYIAPIPQQLIDGNAFVADLSTRGLEALQESSAQRLFEKTVDFAKVTLGGSVPLEAIVDYLNVVGDAYSANSDKTRDKVELEEAKASLLEEKQEVKRFASFAALLEKDLEENAERLVEAEKEVEALQDELSLVRRILGAEEKWSLAEKKIEKQDASQFESEMDKLKMFQLEEECRDLEDDFAYLEEEHQRIATELQEEKLKRMEAERDLEEMKTRQRMGKKNLARQFNQLLERVNEEVQKRQKAEKKLKKVEEIEKNKKFEALKKAEFAAVMKRREAETRAHFMDTFMKAGLRNDHFVVM